MNNNHTTSLPEVYLGIMSGTSLDGIDIVAASFPDDATPTVIKSDFYPLPNTLREALLQLINKPEAKLDVIGQLDQQVAEAFATAVNHSLAEANLSPSDIAAIGSHGITLRHKPQLTPGFSWQVGNPAVIVEKTGITTIGDFRSRDVAAGGQGAPLVPRFHQAIFQSTHIDRAVVNIGGMANVTMLPKQNGISIQGFDTGPGNVMLDYWIHKHKNESYDADGAWARQGSIDKQLLQHFLSDPFFKEAPPKSTGRELFNPEWLQHYLTQHLNQPPANIQATLLELTAISIAESIKQYQVVSPKEVILCGGGALNSYLKARIQAHLPASDVITSDDLGVGIDSLEALAFAWLAKQALHRKPGNIATATGAKGDRVLGAIYFSENT